MNSNVSLLTSDTDIMKQLMQTTYLLANETLKRGNDHSTENKIAETMIRQNFIFSACAANLKKFCGTHESNINEFYNVFERIMISTGLPLHIPYEMILIYLARDPLSFFEKQPQEIKNDYYK